ncbi:MAG: phage terminase small subunit P27 family [Alteromonadaceae bacterium]|nr:phage terminase small subunit P27 family [Alteromonadaceae bacterium]
MNEVRSPGAGKKPSVSAVGDEAIKSVRAPVELIDHNAVECWKTNSKLLIKRGVFASEDVILLLSYCNAHAMMLKCDVALAGCYTTEAGSGGLKKHPLVNVRNDAFAQITRAGSLLGLNPMSRVRFMNGGSGSADEGNEFDDF